MKTIKVNGKNLKVTRLNDVACRVTCEGKWMVLNFSDENPWCETQWGVFEKKFGIVASRAVQVKIGNSF